MKTVICWLLIMGNCLAATISDTAFLYDLSHTNDTNVRPTNEAINQFPDLSVSGAGVTLRYRFNTTQAVLDGIAPAADSSIDAYLAQPGDAFSGYGIAAGMFPVIIEKSISRPQLSVGEEFYVGMAAGFQAVGHIMAGRISAA